MIIVDPEVLEGPAKKIGLVRVHPERWQRARLACQLQLSLLQMVKIEVGIAERVHEIARTQAGGARHHVRQQRIGGDVERHTEEDIG